MNSLLQSKKKNLIILSFTVLHIIMLILKIDLWQFPFIQNFRYAVNSFFIYVVPLISAVLVLVFFSSANKEYLLKKWLLPVAFGANFISNLILADASFSVIGLTDSDPLYIATLLCGALILAAMASMLVGSLFDFKYICFLKYGALGYVIISFIVMVIEFIQVGGFTYLQSVPSGFSPINIPVLIRFLVRMLYYIGIFMFATSKKHVESERLS